LILKDVRKDNDEVAVNRMNMKSGQAALAGAYAKRCPSYNEGQEAAITLNDNGINEFRNANPHFSCTDAMRELLAANSDEDREFYGKLYNAILHETHRRTMNEDGLLWDSKTNRYRAAEY
jgi:hypothetical protein